MKHLKVLNRYFYFISILILTGSYGNALFAKGFDFKTGFQAQECEDILKLNFAFLDTLQSREFQNFQDGYTFLARTRAVGLDNVADLWIRHDSCIVLMLRGTTAQMTSVLEDFYCAMVPARGTIRLSKGQTFPYQLATDPRAAVHAGFLIGFAYLAQELRPQIDSLVQAGFQKVIIGGHSQGGALCYYFSSWLLQLKRAGIYPGLSVKTYASAAPKMGNMYFAYDYDNATKAEWSYSIINTYDPVPEMPFTTQQVDIDMNEPNPILNLMTRFDELPFLKRIFLKNAFNKMKSKAQKSSEAYQKYLGKYVGSFIHESLPDMQLPEAVPTTYFVRPGVPIILSVNDAYEAYYTGAPKYFHHGIDPYRFLLRQYYSGLPAFIPMVKEP
ncbi:MAG: hypothetical protein KL787_08355 [Taibaiella sp.]|nr:hypothetical protein [Taibaiella sp.]